MTSYWHWVGVMLNCINANSRSRRQDLRSLGGQRATIKAHPATPHHPRPYGKGISPERMESPQANLLDTLSILFYNSSYHRE